MPRRMSVLELAAACRRMDNVQQMRDVASKALNDFKPAAITGVKQCFAEQRSPSGDKWPSLQHPRPGENAVGEALRDTGRLMASIQARVEGLSLFVFTVRVGAALMNYGGVVVPKNAKFLCIPATPEAKKAGSPRNFSGRLLPRIGKAGKGGVLIGPVPQGVKLTKVVLTTLEVQYYMTKKVTVPERKFIGFRVEVVRIITDGVTARCWRYILEGFI